MNPKYQPALLGGLLIGVLSGLPLIEAGNVCCCLWVVIGGVLTAYLLQQNQPEPVEASQAMLGGLLAGIIGAVVAVVLKEATLGLLGNFQQRILQQVFEGRNDMPPQFRQLMASSALTHLAILAGLMFQLPLYGIFSMLGALLGKAIFKPKTPPALQG